VTVKLEDSNRLLAVIIYRCVTGRLPFDAPTSIGVLYQVCHADPPALTRLASGLSRRVDRVMARALAKSPDDRHPSVRTFADDLIHALDAPPDTEQLSPETMEQLQLPRRPGGWSKRQLGFLVLLTFSAMMIGAGVVITWLALPSDKPRVPRRALAPDMGSASSQPATRPTIQGSRGAADLGQDAALEADLELSTAPRARRPRRTGPTKTARKKKRGKRRPRRHKKPTKKPPVRCDNL